LTDKPDYDLAREVAREQRADIVAHDYYLQAIEAIKAHDKQTSQLLALLASHREEKQQLMDRLKEARDAITGYSCTLEIAEAAGEVS